MPGDRVGALILTARAAVKRLHTQRDTPELSIIRTSRDEGNEEAVGIIEALLSGAGLVGRHESVEESVTLLVRHFPVSCLCVTKR